MVLLVDEARREAERRRLLVGDRAPRGEEQRLAHHHLRVEDVLLLQVREADAGRLGRLADALAVDAQRAVQGSALRRAHLAGERGA